MFKPATTLGIQRPAVHMYMTFHPTLQSVMHGNLKDYCDNLLYFKCYGIFALRLNIIQHIHNNFL